MRTCVIVLTAIFVLSGCAALKNTPQQDYVWDAANAPPGGTTTARAWTSR
jgi:uncharacterized protein YceK